MLAKYEPMLLRCESAFVELSRELLVRICARSALEYLPKVNHRRTEEAKDV
jgi:hypothetical protein